MLISTISTCRTVTFKSTAGYKSWYYYGFADMDSLKNQAITRNIDRFNYVERIDQSKVNGGSTSTEAPEETAPSSEETPAPTESSAADAA